MENDETKRIELVWPGKRDPGQLEVDAAPSLHVIERVPDPRVPGAIDIAWTNMLVRGDNLATMHALLASFEGKIDLIYIDPPFATGTGFSATLQVGNAGKSIDGHEKRGRIESRAYDDTWKSGLGTYLQVMHDRLVLMHRLLSDKGMLYVHCDWRAVHYLKVMLDSIFGHSGGEREDAGFKSEIIWFHQVIGMPRTNPFYFPKQHETIIAYSKSRKDKIVFNARDKLLRKEFSESIKKAVKKDENGNTYYTRGRTGTKNDWAYDPKYLQTRVNLDDGVLVADVWDEWKSYQPRKDEKTGYPTQKPEQILERIIAASTNPGDLVADFFCGSGTTLAVAGRLGRRWIGCDSGQLAIHATRKRLMRVDGCKPFEIMVVGGSTHVPAGEQANIVIIPRVDGNRITVELAGFTPMTAENGAKVADWLDLVDYWAVDVDHQEGIFTNHWASFRTVQDRGLERVSGTFEYHSNGIHRIQVKVVDVEGCEFHVNVTHTTR
ncbi:MAG: site-specific DNA-methyltransferase [Candidatus Lokiarchaeota archaeon]|nr:site-specific DNA-methyltransferase [Candidatus Lokiarchaeota archaeon]